MNLGNFFKLGSGWSLSGKGVETLYQGVGGEYYHGNSAWGYVRDKTSINLKDILEKIADERAVETQ